MNRFLGVVGVVACLCWPLTGLAATFELLAGQDLDAGNVHVAQSAGQIVVTLFTENGWSLKETHITAACAPEEFPLTKCCNPKVGQFLYGEEDYPPGATKAQVLIPLDGPDSPVPLCNLPSEYVFLAVHAVVSHPEKGTETAWGGCYCDNPNAPKFYTICDRNRGNWAEYFWFVVQE